MVTHPRRVPERGDAVWIDFNPQAGREQAGRRPAVVLSPCRLTTARWVSRCSVPVTAR